MEPRSLGTSAPGRPLLLDDDPAEVELAWEQEIQRRVEEYRRGELQTISSADVFAHRRELSNPWLMDKDGKQRFDRETHEKELRK